MNGSKDEKCGHGLCCSGSMKPVYLGVILFIVGLILQNPTDIPRIIMIIGSLTVIVSLISMFSQKGK